MSNKIISRHLSWINKGLHFEDIMAIREDIRKTIPAVQPTEEVIHQRIGNPEPQVLYEDADLQKLTFLLIDNDDFDGKLEFLKQARNLESIFITGPSSKEKISDLEPLRNLKKLNRIYLANQKIEDISPLAPLTNLKEIDFLENKIRSIEPLSEHRKIHRARFSGVREEEIIRLLQNSHQAIVSFTPKELDFTYHGFWINDWAFKTCYQIEPDHLSVTIEPVRDINGRFLLLTAPNTLRRIILKTKAIVGELMGNSPCLEKSHFTFSEKSKVLKGRLYFQKPFSTAIDDLDTFIDL